MANRFVVKLIGALNALPMLNVFVFEETGSGGSSADLGAIFNTNIVSALCDIITSNVSFSATEIYNFDVPSDFWSGVPTVHAGTISDQSLPPQDCWAYEYARGSRASHNGAKRFAGVPETWQEDGVVVPAHSAAVQAFSSYLYTPLTGASSATYTPRIPRFVYPSPNTSHLPPISLDVFPVSNVLYKGITTQNSRKLNKH